MNFGGKVILSNATGSHFAICKMKFSDLVLTSKIGKRKTTKLRGPLVAPKKAFKCKKILPWRRND